MIHFWDTESDGLLNEATKLHVSSVKTKGNTPFSYTEGYIGMFKHEFCNGATIVGHNIFGHDLPLCIKLGIIKDYSVLPDSITLMDGTVKNVQLLDTLAMSRSWFPDLPGGHSLESWSHRVKTYKPEITDWKNLSIEEYVSRCENDVISTEEVFKYLLDKLGIDDIQNLPFHVKLAQKTYDLMCRQERTGVCFDQEAAKKLVIHIDAEMERIRSEIEPKLPTRPLKKGEIKEWTPPKRQFKKNGELSADILKWCDKCSQSTISGPDFINWVGYKGDIEFTLPYHQPIITELPMELKDQGQIKDWFLSLGWKPTLWNFKKDKRGKFIRDERGQLIKTSPKFHEKGVICTNLEKLGSKVELVRPIITWLSYRHRRSFLLNEEKGTGLLNHPRLKIDGRLPAAASGLTNTKRQKHTVVANVPKVGTLLGKEMRGLFVAAPGKVFVGYDAAGLEARVEAERSYRFDNGLYAAELLEGDIHAKNALVFGTDRDGAKSPKYAITYGCAAPKLAGLLECSTQTAQAYIDNYWETNYSVGQHRQSVIAEWKKNGKKYITGVLEDKIVTRSEHSLLNADFQNFGAVDMDIAGAFMDRYVRERGIDAQRVVYYHDEYIWECFPKDAELIAELGVKSIQQAGKYLKMNINLDADAKIGKNWGEVH